jgi:hypothetical protein
VAEIQYARCVWHLPCAVFALVWAEGGLWGSCDLILGFRFWYTYRLQYPRPYGSTSFGHRTWWRKMPIPVDQFEKQKPPFLI